MLKEMRKIVIMKEKGLSLKIDFKQYFNPEVKP